ncbi:TPA: hypothetical protein PIQ92_000097 [Klebsiella pneumoniae]|uniref:hypothetical protein n=1 Tax=Leclercia sp. TaxID=1898428 RepID=UPI0020650179|nr:hypothetical protein [Leclercia sp.]DAL59994.1 MAG TPA_asm: hypothetical protein [Caudoviricetes sp.]HDH0884609.1 hypothetical protein [Klebsiella pneumoniae]
MNNEIEQFKAENARMWRSLVIAIVVCVLGAWIPGAILTMKVIELIQQVKP